MRALFADDGCRFAYCRMPIGANDYVRAYYSLNDHAGDYAINPRGVWHTAALRAQDDDAFLTKYAPTFETAATVPAADFIPERLLRGQRRLFNRRRRGELPAKTGRVM